MNDWTIVGIILIVLVVVAGGLMLNSWFEKDTWVKDERGVWIRQGEPKEVPEYVLEQHRVIDEALMLYANTLSSGVELNSQCLGVVGEEEKYAVDIVHVPRTEEDNKIENQCAEFRSGEVSHFIELDKDGKVVRIV